MKNKKGFIHTLEAVIAILLLLSVIYIVVPKPQPESVTPEKIDQSYKAIFSEISVNNTFRECLMQQVSGTGAINNVTEFNLFTEINPYEPCLNNINDYVQDLKPRGYVCLAEICLTSASCTANTLPAEATIYAESIMLASKTSKVFRIYFWEK